MSLDRTVRMAGPSMTAGVSTAGNTAGTTGTVSNQLILVGGGGITASQSSDANGATVSMSAKPAFSLGVSNIGNTTGNTGVTGTRMVLAASGCVTLSQDTAAAGGTITISCPNPMMSIRAPKFQLLMGATQGIGASAATQTTVTAWVMPMELDRDLAFNNAFVAVHNSFTSATTSISSINYSYSQGASLGFYTLNGSTMSLVTSFSGSLGFTNATSANATDLKATAIVGMGGSSITLALTGAANMSSIMSSIQSVRKMPLMWSTQSVTMTANQYWAVACLTALTAGANNAALSQVGFESFISAMGSAFNPPAFMKSTASVTSPYPFLGQATLVNSSNSLMPVSFNTNVITTATNTNASTKFQSLWIQLYSTHSN